MSTAMISLRDLRIEIVDNAIRLEIAHVRIHRIDVGDEGRLRIEFAASTTKPPMAAADEHTDASV
jgi:hypothetical protein